MNPDPVREALEKAWNDLEIVFEVKGEKREDGLTATEVEALIKQGNTEEV